MTNQQSRPYKPNRTLEEYLEGPLIVANKWDWTNYSYVILYLVIWNSTIHKQIKDIPYKQFHLDGLQFSSPACKVISNI